MSAGFTRRSVPTPLHLRAALSSADDPMTRAENVLRMIGVRWCDDRPETREAVKRQIADVLGDYAVLDRVTNGGV